MNVHLSRRQIETTLHLYTEHKRGTQTNAAIILKHVI